jgi:hypothetical protein
MVTKTCRSWYVMFREDGVEVRQDSDAGWFSVRVDSETPTEATSRAVHYVEDMYPTKKYKFHDVEAYNPRDELLGPYRGTKTKI